MVARWATKKYVKHCVRLIGLIRVLMRGCNNPNVSITKSRTTPLQPKQPEPYMTGCSEMAKTKKHPGLISVNSRWNITQLSWTPPVCHGMSQGSSTLIYPLFRRVKACPLNDNPCPQNPHFKEVLPRNHTPGPNRLISGFRQRGPEQHTTVFPFFSFRLPKNGNWIDYLGYHKVSTWNAPLKLNKRYRKMT